VIVQALFYSHAHGSFLWIIGSVFPSANLFRKDPLKKIEGRSGAEIFAIVIEVIEVESKQ